MLSGFGLGELQRDVSLRRTGWVLLFPLKQQDFWQSALFMPWKEREEFGEQPKRKDTVLLPASPMNGL